MTGSTILDRCTVFFTQKRLEEKGSSVFVKGLVLFALLKTFTIWSVAETLLAGGAPRISGLSLSRMVFFPSEMVYDHPDLVFGGLCLALFGILFFRPVYLSNIVLFWIALNLFRIKFPVTNGSDYVVLVMSAYAIPLSRERFVNPLSEAIAISAHNLFKVLAGIQICLIYFISAWDKLLSTVWRSGDAFLYISKMETTFNPMFTPLINNAIAAMVLSWITIAFEFLFGIMVWRERFRLITLCIGVIFHFIIWMMLSLPDFALIMIISYLVFLKDKDIDNLLGRIKLLPR